MAGTRHVHEIYIKAEPERIWDALTQPAFTEQWFFGLAVASGWEPAGDYRYLGADGSTAVSGQIVEIDPPRKLVMTFRIHFDPAAADEPPSVVMWEITPVGDACRLTVVHGDLALSPVTWQATVTGWPVLLSAVKTLLETGSPLGDVPDDEQSPHAVAGPVDLAWHRAQAVEANNATWALLDGAGTSDDHDDRLVHTVHASAYHWGIAGGPEHRARAEYMCSRVYAFLGRAEPALHHATRCRTLTDAAGLVDWDLAYSHEAMARALACAGELGAAAQEYRLVLDTAVTDPDDRGLVESDLAAGPWFGFVAP
jgi:uncharacterized protein YndB with AHSA1/START domain